MKLEDFPSDQSGQVVLTMTGYYAFIPHPPPTEMNYNPIVSELSSADAALSELSGISRVLPNPKLLLTAYTGREAEASTQIEGTQASLSDLLQEAVRDTKPSASDVYEIRNYLEALEYGVEALKTLPLATRVIKEMHKRLLREVRGDERLPGEFRTSQNWIRGSGPATAMYVPPPPDRLPELFAGWERFINDRSPMPDLVRCAIAHEYFETLHPFLDGNGRLGRLMITMMLIDRGRLHRPLLYVSKEIEKRKAEYYEKLQRVRTHGERTEWVRYFLRVVEAAARDAVRRADTLLNLRETLRSHSALVTKHRAQRLVDELFVNPYTSVTRAAKGLNVSEPTAKASILLLQGAGIVRETTGKSYGRVWVADAILDAIRRDD